jgi:hypothetical protein
MMVDYSSSSHSTVTPGMNNDLSFLYDDYELEKVLSYPSPPQMEPPSTQVVKDQIFSPLEMQQENNEPTKPMKNAIPPNVVLPQRKGGIHLWQFLYAMLIEPKYSNLIEWTANKKDFEFRLLEPEAIAMWWGHHKNKKSMSYDKLSRSIRYYYDKCIIRKMSGEKYVYQFCIDPELMYLALGTSENKPQLKPLPRQAKLMMTRCGGELLLDHDEDGRNTTTTATVTKQLSSSADDMLQCNLMTFSPSQQEPSPITTISQQYLTADGYYPVTCSSGYSSSLCYHNPPYTMQPAASIATYNYNTYPPHFERHSEVPPFSSAQFGHVYSQEYNSFPSPHASPQVECYSTIDQCSNMIDTVCYSQDFNTTVCYSQDFNNSSLWSIEEQCYDFSY